ncbi:Elongation factor 1-gamma [Schizosaccharomyces pombe]|uniref:translation elongation factor EF-1 gamma subunit n=1 Tax=Schizosaccharomyces pombe TaxID=4896 RepID=UPI00001620A8|nr:translation elongation factor EF-1 gamma subunit [Schizosaccharomyces pombe]CAB10129.1 translation elongation factor EF-1 gamma subunit [Schizosaccharomyces pombe]|eukprot:NP_594880.1 translation elongation factor EF-1 gamma subunit [Schizosaccharomyces pombe]
MSVGTVYGKIGSPRVLFCVSVAAVAGVEVEHVDVQPHNFPADLAAKFPLQKMPVFVGKDGFPLSETLAIAFYLASLNKTRALNGTTAEEKAKVLQYCSFTNSELPGAFRPIIAPRVFGAPYDEQAAKEAETAIALIFARFDEELASKTYLVGSRLTLADIFFTCFLKFGATYVLTKSYLAKYTHIYRYYQTIYHQAKLDAITEPLKFIDQPLPIIKAENKEAAPAKKAEKKKDEKKKNAPKPQAEAPAKPPKHPLASAPNGSFDIEEYKRVYSNQDTRSGALPWFFEHFDPENYSVWKVDYSYPEDLKQPVFMTNNLIGGFFQRLEASRKYIFGCCVVIGENGDNTITGAFVIKGHDYVPAFDVAPDWGSYTFTKLDINKPEDKAFIEDAWAWDKPIEGREVADGKVCK